MDEAANDVRDRVARVSSDLPHGSRSAGSRQGRFRRRADHLDDALQRHDERARAHRLRRARTRRPVQRACPAWRACASAARAATRCGSGSTARRSRRASSRWPTSKTALRRENVQLPAGRLESSQRELTLRTETGLDTEQDFRQLVVGRGPRRLPRAARRGRRRAPGGGERAQPVAVERRARHQHRHRADFQGQHARGRAATRATNSSASGATCPTGTRLEVNLDRSVFIAASMTEVVEALVHRDAARAGRHLPVPRQPARHARSRPSRSRSRSSPRSWPWRRSASRSTC